MAVIEKAEEGDRLVLTRVDGGWIANIEYNAFDVAGRTSPPYPKIDTFVVAAGNENQLVTGFGTFVDAP